MQLNNEITALLQLIDDPDETVFDTVSQKIISYGKPIVPNLEDFWMHNEDPTIHERIEWLVHKVHVNDLEKEFITWLNEDEPELLHGAILLSKFIYPDFNPVFIYQEVERIRRSVWLELNSYLTPLEKLNVIHNVLYKYFRYAGADLNFSTPEHFTLQKLIESKTSNAYALGILYQTLCKLMDIPVYTISIPNQNLLGYFNNDYLAKDEYALQNPFNAIQFFIDPVDGKVYTHENVLQYLERQHIENKPKLHTPQSIQTVIKKQIEQLAICYRQDNTLYKYNELIHIAELIEQHSKHTPPF